MLISSPKALLSPGFDSVGIVFVVRFFVSNCIVIYAILGQSKQNFKKKKKKEEGSLHCPASRDEFTMVMKFCVFTATELVIYNVE